LHPQLLLLLHCGLLLLLLLHCGLHLPLLLLGCLRLLLLLLNPSRDSHIHSADGGIAAGDKECLYTAPGEQHSRSESTKGALSQFGLSAKQSAESVAIHTMK
jgi:hypothetical protein